MLIVVHKFWRKTKFRGHIKQQVEIATLYVALLYFNCDPHLVHPAGILHVNTEIAGPNQDVALFLFLYLSN